MKSKVKLLITIIIFFTTIICFNELCAKNLIECKKGDIYQCETEYSYELRFEDIDVPNNSVHAIENNDGCINVEENWENNILGDIDEFFGAIPTPDNFGQSKTGITIYANKPGNARINLSKRGETITLNIEVVESQKTKDKKEKEKLEKELAKIEEKREYYNSNKRMPATWATSTPNYENVVKWISGLQSVEGQDQIGKIFSELAESPQCLGGLIAARDVLKEAQRKYLLQEPTKTQVNQYSKALEEVIKAKAKGESVENAANKEFHSSKENVDNTIKEIEEKIMALLPKKEGESREPKPNFTDVLTNIEDYTPKQDDTDNSKVEEMTGKILSIITSIGMVLAVIVPAILGVKYMLGSVEEKAEYKKGMIPYVVGAFLLFGICTFVKVLQQFGESINNI